MKITSETSIISVSIHFHFEDNILVIIVSELLVIAYL